VQTTNAGIYSVVVTSDTGSTTSAPATLSVGSVAGGPTILAQPMPASGVLGSTVVLTVNATGEPPLSYQWFLNGLPLPGATSPTLILNNLQMTNFGLYSVSVSNPSGIIFTPSVPVSLGAVRPMLALPQIASNAIQLTISVPTGTTNRLQASTNLVTWAD